MSNNELLERLSSLDCMLKCLSEVGDNNPVILQGMPQALKVVSEYTEKTFEAVANREEAAQ